MPALTERELEILKLLASDMLGKQIAAKLDISPLTLRTHKHNLYKKLATQSRREAVNKARYLGIIT